MTDIRLHQDELKDRCSHCGFCFEYCPVFDATNDGGSGKGSTQQRQSFFQADFLLSSCLQCRGCYPSCYNGLTTTEMVRCGRQAIVVEKGSGHFKNMIFNHVLSHPDRVRSFVRVVSALGTSGSLSLARRLNMTNEDISTACTLLDLDVETAVKNTPIPRARETADRQPVVYFRSCGFSAVLPCVGMTTRALLQALGHPVIELENACCGLPPYAHGDSKAARRLAKKNIDLFVQGEIIVTECGSCSSFLKSYAQLFADDEAYAEKAKRVSELVMDMNVFLHDHLTRGDWHMKTGDSAARIVTYHDPCHLSRYQGVLDQPRVLLKSIRGLDFVELPESDRCCGGAGAYSVANRDISLKILDRKMEKVRKSKANILATSCPACMIQLTHGIKRAGLNITVMHVNQLIAGSIDHVNETGTGGLP